MDELGSVGAGPWLAEAKAWSEARLGAFLGSADLGPEGIAEAVEYALMGGGKRIRPALVRLVGSADGGHEPEAVARAAVAVECIHTYSLVHDDLPCMDDDDLRRGRPTTHRVFGEAAAVLAGDALLTLAFEALTSGPASECDIAARSVAILARAAGGAGMVGGQVLDLAGEGQDLGAKEVDEIHALKTAALLGAAAELGAVAAGLSPERQGLARQYGIAIGMTFQAMDDVLDVEGDAAALGKTPGKDAHVGKGTLVATLGLAGAKEAAERHAAEARDLSGRLGLGPLGVGLVDLLAARSR